MGSTATAKVTKSIGMPCLPVLVKSETPFQRSASKPVLGGTSSQASPPRPRALVSILAELCKGCELCIFACPSGNLTLSSRLNGKGYHPVIFSYNGEKGPCTGCGICYWVCPDMAISKIRKLKQ